MDAKTTSVKNHRAKNHSALPKHSAACKDANKDVRSFKIDRVWVEDCVRCEYDNRQADEALIWDILFGIVYGLIKLAGAALSIGLLVGIVYLIAVFVFGWTGQLDLSLPLPEVTINDAQ